MVKWSIWKGADFSAKGPGYGWEIMDGHAQSGGVIIADKQQIRFGSLWPKGWEYKFWKWFFKKLVEQGVCTIYTLNKFL